MPDGTLAADSVWVNIVNLTVHIAAIGTTACTWTTTGKRSSATSCRGERGRATTGHRRSRTCRCCRVGKHVQVIGAWRPDTNESRHRHHLRRRLSGNHLHRQPQRKPGAPRPGRPALPDGGTDAWLVRGAATPPPRRGPDLGGPSQTARARRHRQRPPIRAGAAGRRAAGGRRVPVGRRGGSGDRRALLAPPAHWTESVAATALATGFLGYLAYARLAAPESSCGCLSTRRAPVTWRSFARAGVLAGAGALSLWSATGWPRRSPNGRSPRAPSCSARPPPSWPSPPSSTPPGWCRCAG